MKIRKGFVSNSSSSSFVCDVCGENYSGYDAGLSEAEMTCCEEGHTYCDSHAEVSIDDMDIEQMRVILINSEDEAEDKEKWKNAEEDEVEEAFDELSYDLRDAGPKENCPCCMLTSITDHQLIEYLLLSKGSNRKDVEKEIRSKYKNYEEMKKDIK